MLCLSKALTQPGAVAEECLGHGRRGDGGFQLTCWACPAHTPVGAALRTWEACRSRFWVMNSQGDSVCRLSLP